jgi:hypothetical protein
MYPTLLKIDSISAIQMKGKLSIYIEYRLSLLHTFPHGCAMVFKASVTKIQKHVCHETSGRAAWLPSDDIENFKTRVRTILNNYTAIFYVPIFKYL